MKQILCILINLLFICILKGQIVVFTEDFESAKLPEGWTQESKASDGGWRFGSNSYLSSQYFNFKNTTNFTATNDDACNCDKTLDKLITPVLDLSEYSSLQLTFDLYFYASEYQSLVESGKVELSTDNGVSWKKIYDLSRSLWDNIVIDLSAYTGKSAVKLAFTYSDGGGWLYGMGIDNVKILVPFNYDVRSKQINLTGCLQTGPKDIVTQFVNKGKETINFLIYNYQIDNNPVVSESNSNLKIKPAEIFNYTFKNKWVANMVGSHSIKVWASDINDNADQDPLNDKITNNVNLYKAGKPVLVEYFTNTDCPACGYYVPYLEETLNKNEGIVLGLSYHTNWPGSGDPMNNSIGKSDIATRVSYYAVDGVPASFINGKKNSEILFGEPCSFADITRGDTVIDIINPFAEMTKEKLSFSATVRSLKKVSANLKAYIAVLERDIHFDLAPGSNGEIDFNWVMKKMFPNAAGTALPATMNIDDNKQISGEWIFGNAKIYDKTKLRVLFFVQNYSSKEVLWATMISPVMDVEEFNTDQFINIFPNPCSSQTKIDFMLDKPENVSFKLINSFGQEINNIDLGIKFAGRNDYTLYTKDMKAGLYYLIFQRGDMKSFKKIIIN